MAIKTNNSNGRTNMSQPLRVTMHIDGGSRGNPGPAGAGVVIADRTDQQSIYEAGFFLGNKTNNQAEYAGLLAGLKAAGRLGVAELEVFSDSQLLVRQMLGEYRVKNQGLILLFQQAQKLASGFSRCEFQHIRREKNVEADRLANRAMDARGNVEDAGE